MVATFPKATSERNVQHISMSSVSLLCFVWVLVFSELDGMLKERPDLIGGVHFSYSPAGVRLDVSMMEDQAVGATAGSPRQSQRELLCLFGTIS